MNFKFKLRQIKENILYAFRFLKSKLDISDLELIGSPYYSIEHLKMSNYTVKRNMWGKFKIREKHLSDFRIKINSSGWVFETPSKNYGVIGYPSITFDDNPIEIRDIKSYRITYFSDLLIEANRKFNTSFDFWVGREATFSFPNVTHEIMIWDNYFVAMPFGKFRGEVKLSHRTYRVYSGYIDKSTENLGTLGWTYIAFLAVDRTDNSDIDMVEVFDFLTEKGLVKSDSYLLRSEFGNEVYNATGEFKISRFKYLFNGNTSNII